MRHLVLFVAFLLAAGCSSGGGESTTSPPGTGAPPVTSIPGSPVTTGRAADALEERLAWLTQVLEDGDMSEADYEATFTADFLANVSYSEMVAVIRQVAATGSGWQVQEFEERDGLDGVVVLAPQGGGEGLRASISLESQAPYRIQGLFLQPAEAPTLDEPPGDFAEAAERLAAFGNTELLVAEVDGGTCEPVFEHGTGEPFPIGSAFKLYVLGAVADEVESGVLAWSDDVEIREDLKSIPTGVMQDEEAGTTFSLREMAEVMIALSDNTATDHLMDLVGRDAVEAAFTAHGMAEPALNIPVMNTLELAALKVGPASGLATQWLEADEDGRREILDQISDLTPADIPVSEFTEPVFPDRLEWFATGADICRVLVGLFDRGDPLNKILTINPGLEDEEGRFESIAFKGGSEPGLVAMNWLVERSDGRRFVVSGSVVDPDEAFEQVEVILLFGAVRDLVSDI